MFKCFKCEKELEEDRMPSQTAAIGIVYGGTIWRATGNYGSTIYDPMRDETFLEISVCDECLKNHKVLIRAARIVRENTARIDISVDEALACY